MVLGSGSPWLLGIRAVGLTGSNEGQTSNAASCGWKQGHTVWVDGHNELEILETALKVVNIELRERNVMSCVFGSRLLCDLLTHAQIDNTAVGVLLTVADPEGRMVVVGNHNLDPDNTSSTVVISDPTGFKGHVVVLARANGAVHLVDPTAFQVNRFWANSLRTPPGDSIILRLSDQNPLALQGSATETRNGWAYRYEPAPDVDWQKQPEWVNEDRFRLPELVRGEFTRETGISFPPSPQRNAPCPCGSGKKYKRCHGAPRESP